MSETIALSGFLLARIEEDEASVITGSCVCDPEPQRPDCPDRILADCEAKRRIVGACAQVSDMGTDSLDGVMARDACRYSLRALAAVYADHPDFREEWRP